MSVKTIPDGYHSVNAYLVVPGVAQLIDFLIQAFEAEETERMSRPDGAVMHAEVRIGDSTIMMGEPMGGDWKAMPCALYLYIEDVDAAYHRAVAAGATSVMEPADQFYGDRNATVRDASGNMWCIAAHKEDVAPEELQRRAEEAMKKRAST